jgi:hypothetical protein
MTQASRTRRLVRRGSRGRTEPPDSGGRYGLLLLVLIATYLLSAFSGQKAAAAVEIGLFAVVLVLALRSSPLPGRWPALIIAVTVGGSVAAALGAPLAGTPAVTGAADLWKALMLLLTAALIVHRVLARPVVTIQSIYGALSAYLVIGLMFASCYAAIQHLGGMPFFADGKPVTTQTLQYFSFTTLTTLGYGDFTAAGNGGRAIAVMEALAGQVFLVTLVARLVTAYRSPVQQKSPPPSRFPPHGIRRGARTITRTRPPGSSRRSPDRQPAYRRRRGDES